MQRKFIQIVIQTKDLSVELHIPQHWCAEVLTYLTTLSIAAIIQLQ